MWLSVSGISSMDLEYRVEEFGIRVCGLGWKVNGQMLRVKDEEVGYRLIRALGIRSGIWGSGF